MRLPINVTTITFMAACAVNRTGKVMADQSLHQTQCISGITLERLGVSLMCGLILMERIPFVS
jgi:hypothetical protein